MKNELVILIICILKEEQWPRRNTELNKKFYLMREIEIHSSQAKTIATAACQIEVTEESECDWKD